MPSRCCPYGCSVTANRWGSYLGMLLLAVGPMGTFYLVTLYMQHILGYSPMRTGLAWLPFAVGIALSSGVVTKLVTRIPPRVLAPVGMLIASAAVFWLSTMDRDASYALHLLPGIFFTAFGFGMGFVPLTLTGVHGVASQDSGIASALLNAAQQIGVALGLALLATVAVTTTAHQLPDALAALYQGRTSGNEELVTRASDALVQGYSSGLAVGALILVVAAVITALVINARPQPSAEEPTQTPTH